MRKNRRIKPKIRWKAKKSPNVWQGQHQALEVLQALISLTQEIIFQTENFFCSLCKLKSLPQSGKAFLRPLGKRLGSTNGREGDKIISDEHGIGGTEFSNLIV